MILQLHVHLIKLMTQVMIGQGFGLYIITNR